MHPYELLWKSNFADKRVWIAFVAASTKRIIHREPKNFAQSKIPMNKLSECILRHWRKIIILYLAIFYCFPPAVYSSNERCHQKHSAENFNSANPWMQLYEGCCTAAQCWLALLAVWLWLTTTSCPTSDSKWSYKCQDYLLRHAALADWRCIRSTWYVPQHPLSDETAPPL